MKYKVGDYITWDSGQIYLVKHVNEERKEYNIECISSEKMKLENCFHGWHSCRGSRRLTKLEQVLK